MFGGKLCTPRLTPIPQSIVRGRSQGSTFAADCAVDTKYRMSIQHPKWQNERLNMNVSFVIFSQNFELLIDEVYIRRRHKSMQIPITRNMVQPAKSLAWLSMLSQLHAIFWGYLTPWKLVSNFPRALLSILQRILLEQGLSLWRLLMSEGILACVGIVNWRRLKLVKVAAN